MHNFPNIINLNIHLFPVFPRDLCFVKCKNILEVNKSSCAQNRNFLHLKLFLLIRTEKVSETFLSEPCVKRFLYEKWEIFFQKVLFPKREISSVE